MNGITIRPVTQDDAPLLRHLAVNCPPLDVHTQYTYWVIASYYGNHCFIALYDNKPIGFITSVKNDDTLFIWQIGILEEYREKNISQLLIDSVIKTMKKSKIKTAAVTIAVENLNSFFAFKNYCEKNGFSFENVSTAHVTDFDDPDFVEDEKMYLIRKKR